MRFKDYKEEIAAALVEVFDLIYTYPLLRWRAFFRSLLITTLVAIIYVVEFVPIKGMHLSVPIFRDVEIQVNVRGFAVPFIYGVGH